MNKSLKNPRKHKHLEKTNKSLKESQFKQTNKQKTVEGNKTEQYWKWKYKQ